MYYFDASYPDSDQFYGTWAVFSRIRHKGSHRGGTLKVTPAPASLMKCGVHWLYHDAIADRMFAVHATGRCSEGRKRTDGGWEFQFHFSA